MSDLLAFFATGMIPVHAYIIRDSVDFLIYFIPNSFTDIGSAEAVRQALSRLTKNGFIRRLAFGLYEYPRQHKKFGQLPPKVENIIAAIEKRDNTKGQPSGAYAANLLGLGDQVPAKIVLLTDGETKTIEVGKIKIIFKKTTPRNMKTAGTITGLIIQAFRFIGKDAMKDKNLASSKKRLSKQDQKRLRLDCALPPTWIAKIITEQLLEE